jgi:ADP-L-glycero-D-manno-heptose 6-epimerase
MHHRKDSGIYNLGTGQARSFLDLADNTFKGMDKNARIEFKDTPEDIRENYQYFTEAAIGKLRDIGYEDTFYALEDGVKDYVRNYLNKKAYY